MLKPKLFNDVMYKMAVLAFTGLCYSCLAYAQPKNAPPAKQVTEPTALILNLPEDQLSFPDQSMPGYAFVQQKKPENDQVIAGGKKKVPLNVNCGMDIYQNPVPDISSISNRVAGECDVKYRF